MSLTVGSRFGSHEILSVIGEGGMGRVYRARDTKLQRIVAVKVLPESVAGDAERIARFEREARTLAALNHPHIAQIYGLEDTGGGHALLMECVEGEDLAQRIARGAMPWREALPVAKQIAEALEAAHEQGIVHRDLKPANIKVTADGLVKVLDFGLAKAMEGDGFSRRQAEAEASAPQTITSPAAVTQAGMILGTAAYMSPEQAKGRAADKRSDVWSFGCILYEMLTAKRAFPGDDVMETLSAVIRADPDFNGLPQDIPSSARALIEQCLIKDRRERISDIAAARYALRLPDSAPRTEARPSFRSAWALVAIAGVVAIAAVALGLPRFTTRPADPQPVIRSMIAAPNAGVLGFATLAISRQGTHIAYASETGGIRVRKLSESEARPLQGTDGGHNPFFSYDGEWLAFFAEGKLKKVSLSGGAAQVLADAPSGRGGSWGPDGTIVFTPAPEVGLSKVSADGGDATVLTTLEPTERSHRWPHVLPGGRTVLFTIQPAGRLYDDAVTAAVPIAGGERQTVIEGGSAAQFAESGHLIYGNGGNLLAIAFDPGAARTSGAAITVIENARTNELNGATPFGVSSAGVLVYLPVARTGVGMTLLSATRSGQVQTLLDRRLFNDSFRLSPDGRRVAVSINDGQDDIWIVDLQNRGLNRFTLGAGSESYPVWSPDGARLYYSSNTGGAVRAYSKAVDGSTAEEAATAMAFFPMSIAPDGRALAGRAITRNSFDVVIVDLKDKSGMALVASPANESEPAFSPDGQFVAYQSDETGRSEIFVRAYASGSTWQVSTGGGNEPRWTSGGRELVYRSGNTIVAVPVTLRPFSFGPAQTLFSSPNLFAFDVTADGKQFVIGQDEKNREDVNFVLISGWFEELKAKMRPSR